MTEPARSRARRRRDTEARLASDVDAWVATASPDGSPYLVPLSFDWDGEVLVMATPLDSPTGRNLAAPGTVRVGLGPTRDVTMIDGEVSVLEIGDLPEDRIDSFVRRAGFDPRGEPARYRWFLVTPSRVQAWREVNELPDRDLMREGRWLTVGDDAT